MKFEIAPKSTEVQLNWNDTNLYCFSLNVDGKYAWRLPTKEELNEIYQSQNDFKKSHHWSSTEFSSNRVWVQNMRNGYHLSCDKYSGFLHVRAIRDLKDN